MKNLRLYFICFALSCIGCWHSTKRPSYQSLKDMYGVVLLTEPTDSRKSKYIFLPYEDQADAMRFKNDPDGFFKCKFKPGILFTLDNASVDEESIAFSKHYVYSAEIKDRKIFWLPNVKMKYYYIKEFFTEDEVIDKDIIVDKISYNKQEKLVNYYFSDLIVTRFIIKHQPTNK